MRRLLLHCFVILVLANTMGAAPLGPAPDDSIPFHVGRLYLLWWPNHAGYPQHVRVLAVADDGWILVDRFTLELDRKGVWHLTPDVSWRRDEIPPRHTWINMRAVAIAEELDATGIAIPEGYFVERESDAPSLPPPSP